MLFFAKLFATLAMASALVASTIDVGPHNWDVTVGGSAGLVFSPSYLQTTVGDTITFHFGYYNHSATQGSFDNPCVPLDFGLDSGFVLVSDGATVLPTWGITVQDINPIYFFSKQIDECAGNGMVFAANVDTTNFNEYQARAIALGTSTTTLIMARGEPTPV